MAGIQGMANPKDVQPLSDYQRLQQSVQADMPASLPNDTMSSARALDLSGQGPAPVSGAPLDLQAATQVTLPPYSPSAAADRAPAEDIDYDALAQEAMSGAFNNDKGEIDYDKLAQTVVNRHKSFFDKAKDVGMDVLNAAADIGKRIVAPAEGIANQMASRYANNTGLASVPSPRTISEDIVKGIYKGATDPHAQPTFGDSIAKVVPALGKDVTVSFSSPGTSRYAQNYSGIPQQDVKPFEIDLKPSDALGLAMDIFAGDATIKGISKAASMTKLMKNAAQDYLAANKAYKATASAAKEAGATPVQEVAVKVSEARKLGDEAAKIYNIKVNPAVTKYEDAAERAWGISLDAVPEIKKANTEAGQAIMDAADSVIEAFGNKAPKAGGMDAVRTKLKDSVMEEGKVIGDFRKQLAALPDQPPFHMEKTKEFLSELKNKYVYNAGADSVDLEATAAALNVSPDEARQIVKSADLLFNRTSGAIPYQEQLNIYNANASKLYQSLPNTASGNAKQLMRDMRRAFVADFDASAEALASRGDKTKFQAYLKDKQEFGILKDEAENLTRALKDNIKSVDSFADYLLDPSSGANRIRAAERMLEATGDELLIRDLKGALGRRIFERGVVEASADNPLLRYDFSNISNELNKLGGKLEGTNLLTQITGDARLSDNLKGLAELAKRVQSVHNPLGEAESLGMLGRMGYLAKQAEFSPKFFHEILKSVGRSNKIEEYLTTMNVQKVVSRFPKSEKPQLMNFFKEAVKAKEDAAAKLLKKPE